MLSTNGFKFTTCEQSSLLKSIGAMVKPDGLVSVFAKHVDDSGISRIKKDLKETAFYLETQLSTNLIHNGSLRADVY